MYVCVFVVHRPKFVNSLTVFPTRYTGWRHRDQVQVQAESKESCVQLGEESSSETAGDSRTHYTHTMEVCLIHSSRVIMHGGLRRWSATEKASSADKLRDAQVAQTDDQEAVT